MYNSKLILIVAQLQRDELRALRKYIRSPYHSTFSDAETLFEYLYKCKQLDEKHLERTYVFKRLFPKVNYDYQRLRNAMSQLLKTIERFLVDQYREDDVMSFYLDLAENYARRNLDKPYDQAIRSINAQYIEKDRDGRENLDYYHKRYRFHSIQYNHQAAMARGGQLDLEQLTLDLDIYYYCSKLKLICSMLTHATLFKQEYKLEQVPEILRSVEQLDYESIPLLNIYYHATQMLLSEAPEAYNALSALMTSSAKGLSHEEQKDVYTLMVNYCIKAINRGDGDYMQHVFDIYKESIERGALMDEGKLSPFTYKNVVTVGLRLAHFDWVEQFTHDFKDRLINVSDDSYFSFNLARLYFAKEEFDACINILNQAEIEDFFTNLAARVMQIKAFYEVGEMRLLDSLITNFAQQLRRKKVLAYHKTNYKNFASVMRKLINVNQHDKEAVEQLMVQVNEIEVLSERPWVLAKIEAMK